MRSNFTKNRTITLPLPTFTPILLLFSDIYQNYQSNLSQTSNRFKRLNGFKKFNFRKFNVRPKKRFLIALGALVLLIALVFWGKNIASWFVHPISGGGDQRASVESAKAQTVLNRDFDFPIKDDKGTELSKIKLTVQNMEKRDEIIVKGQRATSVKGRTFLITNLKIVNNYDKAVQINTRDYVRLSVNNNDQELLAPDIHNDPVEIQAISTKYTRVGFPINDTDKNIKLHIGEIKGQKTVIPVSI